MVDRRQPLFVEPLQLVDVATNTALPGHPAGNVARLEMIGLIWRTDGGAAPWLRGQLAPGKVVDFCAIIAANAQPGTAYRLRLGSTPAEVDGNAAPYDSGARPFITPAVNADDGLYHSHLEIGAAIAASWWRIDIIGHVGPFETAGVVLGKSIAAARFYDRDYERGIEPLDSLNVNRFAVPDITDGYVLRTLSFTLSWLTEEEHETMFAPLTRRLGSSKVVYCCFDPAPSVYRQARTYMGWLGRPPFAKGAVKPRTVSMDFAIRSLI